MCFNVSLTREAFIRNPRYHYLLTDDFEGNYHYNALHFPDLPILYGPAGGKAVTAGWGLIPSWIKDAKDASAIRYKTINARSETVDKKPSFRDCWPDQRCIVPVEGFFEQHIENKIKNPWYITRKDRKIFFLGGIYQYTPEAAEKLAKVTFSILTAPAEGLLAKVHNDKLRMPLMINADKAYSWLERSSRNTDLLDPAFFIDQNLLEAWPVNNEVFKKGGNVPSVRIKHTNTEKQKLFDF